MNEGTELRRIIAISDFCTTVPPQPGGAPGDDLRAVRTPHEVPLRGGYRGALAAVRAGLTNGAATGSFVGDDATPTGLPRPDGGISHRRFRADLRCGLRSITPSTSRAATTADFSAILADMRHTSSAFLPRGAVLQRWTWPQAVDRLARVISAARQCRDTRSGS